MAKRAFSYSFKRKKEWETRLEMKMMNLSEKTGAIWRVLLSSDFFLIKKNNKHHSGYLAIFISLAVCYYLVLIYHFIGAFGFYTSFILPFLLLK